VLKFLEFVIERLPQHGGNIAFTSYADLEDAFADKVSQCLHRFSINWDIKPELSHFLRHFSVNWDIKPELSQSVLGN